ncbi:MAG: hypothetical protein ACUVTZ_11555 [Armatimonadota bacterium]
MRRSCFSACILLLIWAVGEVWAAPAGLNLIPTADFYEPGSVSLEYQTDCEGRLFGGQQARYVLLQAGILPGLEVGLDKCVTRDGGPFVVNAKFRLMGPGARRPALAVGVQNVGAGQVGQPYVVCGVGFDQALRGHMGAISIDGTVRGMFGVDYTWRRWTFQCDWVSGEDNAAGIGISFNLGSGLYVTYSLFLPNARGRETGHSVNLQRILTLG